jgi:sugar lactone lactonase YvrE
MVKMVMAEQVTAPLTYHGEGAVWYSDWGGLKWVDMLAGDILSLDSETGNVSRLHVDSPVAAMVRPRSRGGFVVATEREFVLWGDGGMEWSTPPLWSDARRRFNEGGCDPSGGIICGSVSYELEAGAGEVFRMNADRTTERLFGDVTISNGLGFNAHGSRMYYIDTKARRIDLWDVDGGRLFNRRPFVTIPEGVGNPDGLWVDEGDGVWVALYGGSAVYHLDSNGALEDVIEVPASQVTSCTFGGPNLDTLFITTSRENLAADEQPNAGAVFSAPVGVRGLPVITCDA